MYVCVICDSVCECEGACACVCMCVCMCVCAGRSVVPDPCYSSSIVRRSVEQDPGVLLKAH